MAQRKLTLYLQNEGDRPRAVGELEVEGDRVVGFELSGEALLSADAHVLARLVRGATLAGLDLTNA